MGSYIPILPDIFSIWPRRIAKGPSQSWEGPFGVLVGFVYRHPDNWCALDLLKPKLFIEANKLLLALLECAVIIF